MVLLALFSSGIHTQRLRFEDRMRNSNANSKVSKKKKGLPHASSQAAVHSAQVQTESLYSGAA